MKLQNYFITAVILFATTVINAQDTNEDSHTIAIGIPQVALLDIESTTGTTISLTATAPTEAGEKVVFNQTNSDLWINYSSIVGSESTRAVSVQITGGAVPDGLALSVVAAEDVNQGEGTTGTASAEIVLSNENAPNIITGVGSAYTGNGANKGHNLTYKIAQDNEDDDAYSKLRFDQSPTITITYTLSDI